LQKELALKLKNLSILFVEDEVGIRENIAHSLRYLASNVIEAENGSEGYKLYKKHKPDIIITDILMPVMDGITMVRKIREEDSQTCIIIATAHTDKEYLLGAIDLYLEQYLVKPVNLKKLLEALEKCVLKICESRGIEYKLPLGYSYNSSEKILSFKDSAIKLTKKELAFLEVLIENGQNITTYSELQGRVWQDDVMTDSALRSLVRNLRKKLPIDFIQNLSGIGYKIAIP